ncbi:M48 family metallopeptidase [Advenella sp. WQ 585]|uniref:M48 family metallopeptidase n=1 Tax=Advenella mandrilli TaxID=2800330 RepID=A0ABS1E9T8_9BURK|nr:SprT family zinc-dependent metalloprotease [Advenella mandrilli]MBK1780264.1 M48 family metallopeptidase [Advenella mandrilli]
MDKIPYTLQRSNRKSIGFTINAEGLKITAPQWVSQAIINQAIQAKKTWIQSKLLQWRQQSPTPTNWQHGMPLPYLGRQIIVQLNPQLASCRYEGNYNLAQDNDILYINLPSTASSHELKSACTQWFKGRALAWFETRLHHFGQSSGAKPLQLRLSSATTRWGSCSANGNIRLNWRLIHLDSDLIDYVIAHELAHLKEMNHSSRFWTEVGRILPGYEAAKHKLKQKSLHTLPIL